MFILLILYYQLSQIKANTIIIWHLLPLWWLFIFVLTILLNFWLLIVMSNNKYILNYYNFFENKS